MILWVKRAAAISSGILLAVVLYEHPALAVAGAILNLACVVDGRLPSVFGRLVGPSILVVNTAMSASAVLGGAPAILAMLTAATSLLTWNTGLFLQRWGDAPLAVQYQFLKQLAHFPATLILHTTSARDGGCQPSRHFNMPSRISLFR